MTTEYKREFEGDVMACGEEQYRELLTSLHDVMQDEAFADLKVRLGDGELLVSRPLVAALSPVFRRMLTDPMREKNEGEIVLEYVSMEHWDILVTFYLTGERRVTAGNVVQIVELAHLLDMKSLVRLCSRVLSESVALENWSTFLEIANKYELEDCIKSILSFMGKNFEAVSTMDQFCKVPMKNLEDILADSFLVNSEDSVCKAVLSWLEKNQADDETAEKLSKMINLENISATCMTHFVMYHPQVLSCEAVRRRVASLVRRRYSALPDSGRVFERPAMKSDSLLVLGNDGQRLYLYLEAADQWHDLPAGKATSEFAACIFRESLYVTGGVNTQRSTFVLHEKTWSTGPDLIEGRHNHAMVCANKALFVVAGNRSSEQHSSVEELRVKSWDWATVGYLRIPTASCGTAAVGNTIFVVGGKTGDAQYVIQSFDTVTKTASVLQTKLPKAVTSARGVTVADGAVFLSRESDLFSLKISSEGEPSLVHNPLSGFQLSWPFGLLVDSHVKVFKGNSKVEWFSLDGKKVAWDTATVPASFEVNAVFRTKMSIL